MGQQCSEPLGQAPSASSSETRPLKAQFPPSTVFLCLCFVVQCVCFGDTRRLRSGSCLPLMEEWQGWRSGAPGLSLWVGRWREAGKQAGRRNQRAQHQRQEKPTNWRIRPPLRLDLNFNLQILVSFKQQQERTPGSLTQGRCLLNRCEDVRQIQLLWGSEEKRIQILEGGAIRAKTKHKVLLSSLNLPSCRRR